MSGSMALVTSIVKHLMTYMGYFLVFFSPVFVDNKIILGDCAITSCVRVSHLSGAVTTKSPRAYLSGQTVNRICTATCDQMGIFSRWHGI